MKKILLFLAVALGVARAEILLTEPFNYPNGPIVGASGSPWANNSGATPMLVTNGGVLEVNAGRAEDIVAPLSKTVTTNGTITSIYSSFSATVIGLPSAQGSYFAHFTGGAGIFRARVWTSISNAAPGKVRLGIGNSSGAGATNGQWAVDLDTNVAYLVVTRLDLATGLATIWINPTAESDPSVTANDAPSPADISNYSFRQASGIGVTRVDNLRVATSFIEVTSANNPPTISSIPTQRIAADGSTGPLPFVVGDAETAATSLVVTRGSSNPLLVPTNNIVIGGSASNRTVTISPAAGQEGSSIITLTVTDGDTVSASTAFTVFVGAPSISDIPAQRITTNTSLSALAFTIYDAETPNGLVVTATSTNTTLVPDANITIDGSGTNRTISITPAGNQAGVTLITVTVSDGTQSASDMFTLTVSPQLGVLIDEPFSYSDGTHIADGSTPWINHSGIFGQTIVTNGKVLISQTNTEDFNREFFPLSFPPSSGVILYASFTVNFSQLPAPSGDYFMHYKDDGTLNFRARVFASSQGAPAGQFRIGIANQSASVSTNALFPLFLNTNVNYTVVTRYNVAAGDSAIWINPASESSTSVAAVDAPATLTALSIALRQSTGIGTFTVDDLKVGTAFTNVVAVVPQYSLRVFRSGDSVTIAWPTAATADGFTLQTRSDLFSGNWGPGPASSVSGNENVVTITAPTGTAFFRLIK